MIYTIKNEIKVIYLDIASHILDIITSKLTLPYTCRYDLA